MSKRRAGTELTHDNWDEEVEEEEEAGVFQTADQKVIAKRAIKKAKRRFPGGEQGEEADSPSSNPFSAFKGFGGFSATTATTKKPDLNFGATASPTKKADLSFGATATTTKKPDLSFGAAAANTKKPELSFGAAAATTKKPDLTFSSRDNKPKVACTPAESTAPVISSFVIKSSPKPTSTTSTPSESKSVNGSSSSITSTNMNPEYSKQLKSLNQSVSAWIQQHVNDNPLCDLTPVFEDYKKHLQQIESKYSQKNTIAPVASAPAPSSASSTTTSASSTTTSSSFGGFNFVKSAASTTTAAAPSQSSFSFKPTSSASTGASSGTATSGFSFLKSPTDSSAGGAAQTKPFSFGLAQAPSTASKTEASASGAGGDENEPPKVEFKQVEEKDALYSKRCKLFYKKDDTFKDRGVGMLYLKKTGERGQILLRADTNLGNVILNVGIHPSMPATRQGKNNVLIMTAMNPPINEKCPKCNKKYPNPQESNRCDTGCAPDVEPLLLRVKSGEDADHLLEEINKLKE